MAQPGSIYWFAVARLADIHLKLFGLVGDEPEIPAHLADAIVLILTAKPSLAGSSQQLF
jgi:hypothetical protein